MLNEICGFILMTPIYLIFLIVSVKRNISLKKQLVWFLFFCYIGAVVSVTLFPFPYDYSIIKDYRKWQYLKNNYIPFKSILELLTTQTRDVIIRNILGNILLSMPFGFLFSVLYKKYRSYKNIFFAGLLFSIAIEGSQFLLSLALGYTYKITDVDDIILNVTGTIIGYTIFKLLCVIKEPSV